MAAEPVEAEIDLRQLVKVLRKRAWLIGVVAVLAVATAGALSLFVLPPVYQAEVTLMVSRPFAAGQRTGTQGSLESAVDPLARLPQLTLNTYVAQLTSPRLLEQVAADLGFDRSVWTPDVLASMIRVEALRDTNLIRLRVQSPDPDVARAVADALSLRFLAYVTDTNREQLEKSVEFLIQQAAVVKAERDGVADQLRRLQVQPDAAALLEEQARTHSALLAASRSDLIRARVEADAARGALQRLDQQLAAIPLVVVAEQVTEVVDGQERVVSRKETVNPVYLQLSELRGRRAVDVAEREARVIALAAQLTTLEREVEQLTARLVQRSAQESALAQEVARLDATYRLLSEKTTETQIVKSLDLGQLDLSVVSPATTPRAPVRPNVRMNVAVAGMLGMMLGLLLVFAVEYLDNTVKTPQDVAAAVGLPVLGQIPRFGPGAGAWWRRWALGGS